MFEEASVAAYSDSSVEIKRQLCQITGPTRLVANERIQPRTIGGLGVAIEEKSRVIGICEGFRVKFLKVSREVVYALGIEVLPVSPRRLIENIPFL